MVQLLYFILAEKASSSISFSDQQFSVNKHVHIITNVNTIFSHSVTSTDLEDTPKKKKKKT